MDRAKAEARVKKEQKEAHRDIEFYADCALEKENAKKNEAGER